MNNTQQPGWPEQPEPGQPRPNGNDGAVPPPPPAAPGQAPWLQRTPYGTPPVPPAPESVPYGAPHGTPGNIPAKPKGGIPLWGWIGGGVAVVGLLGVGAVVLANTLAGALKPDPEPCGSGASGCLPPSPSASAGPEASAGTGEAGSLYLFDESDFAAPPVWSIRKSPDWEVQDIKGGTVTYRNSTNNCLFTTHQAILPPTGETTDEAATALTMEQEIAGIRAGAAGNFEVVDDSGSVYAKLRNDDGATIELQEAELRFTNRKDVDLVYRVALRSMPGSDGLMELTQVCPANAPSEDLVWSENTESVTMIDDPAAPKP